MRILGSEAPQGAVTRRRYDAPGGWVDGVYDAGSPTDTTIAMSFQPLDGDDLQSLDEGDRTRATRKGYTKTPLRVVVVASATDPDGVPADEIVAGGIVYEVRRVEYQGGIPALAHYKAILVALREAS